MRERTEEWSEDIAEANIVQKVINEERIGEELDEVESSEVEVEWGDGLSVFDASTMRDDIVSRLLGGDADLETNRYLDRLVELSEVEEAEHQFLIDPFDRSVALVFQLFQNSDLDPWDVDLTVFLELFTERINNSENIDLPSRYIISWKDWIGMTIESLTKVP